ncbi:hypothetical protein CLCR_07839 [Cladophialophora carrionii]|uniref:Uncharacterized protein n=1 Tax=Cladophialophora carrionii TaxID=86049 RepID=A0A1C1CQM1_9EURO|nr:hypothetical protein CLCR_07839 [Cladophialophora carrionii]
MRRRLSQLTTNRSFSTIRSNLPTFGFQREFLKASPEKKKKRRRRRMYEYRQGHDWEGKPGARATAQIVVHSEQSKTKRR